jgi:Na+/melibiose symporter-like transporter
MIMGYRLVQAVLVVTVGRLGDMFGRVRIYNAGFAVFTVASILLSFDPFDGGHGAMWLIGWRVLQAVGGSMLTANSAAILTDAFPKEQRGFALGINQVAGSAGCSSAWSPAACSRPGTGGRCSGSTCRSGSSSRLGLPHAARHRPARRRPDRLVGQHHLRGRSERGPDRGHLRPAALRRTHHGLDQSAGRSR